MHNEIFYTNKDINEFKIAVISDIHYFTGYKQKTLDSIIKQIKKNTPNFIVIVGDILDSSDTSDLTQLRNFFVELSELAPSIAVKGNHDEKRGRMKHWQANKNDKLILMLNSINNFYYLDDKSITINNINFYGFNLSYHYYEEVNEEYQTFCDEVKDLKCNLNDTLYNVTLFHSPVNIYKFLKENKYHNLNKSDLIISGHMHNGCLPFIISHPINKIFKSTRGLLSPARTMFPKYAQGKIYERDGYVYEGITKLSHSTRWLHKFDILFRKRVEFLTIRPQKKQVK